MVYNTLHGIILCIHCHAPHLPPECLLTFAIAKGSLSIYPQALIMLSKLNSVLFGFYVLFFVLGGQKPGDAQQLFLAMRS